jgi:hypothetical protein
VSDGQPDWQTTERRKKVDIMRNFLFAAIAAIALTASGSGVYQSPASLQQQAAAKPPAMSTDRASELAWGRGPQMDTDKSFQTAQGYDGQRPETDRASPNGSA